MKRILAISIIMAVLLAGFGYAQAAVEIRLWDWASGATAEATKVLVEEFNRTHPDIEVIYEFQGPSGNDLLTKLTAAMAAGAHPEISVLQDAWGSRLKKSGLVVPIEEFILGPDGLDAESVADFLPSVYEPFSFDGVQWFLPLRSESSLLSYNKDLFREIGIEAFPETWDSFRESMKKIAADLDGDGQTDRWGTTFIQPITWLWAPFLWGAGGDFFNADYTKSTFNSEAGRMALQYWVDLVNKDKVAPVTVSAVAQGFQTGQVGVNYLGSWMATTISEEVSFDWGASFWPYPESVGPDYVRSLTKVGIIGVFKTTPEKQQAAWTFAKWITSPEILARYCMTASWLPVRESVAADSEFQEFTATNPGMNAFVMNQHRFHLTPIIPAWSKIDYDLIRPAIESALYQELTVEQALANAQRQADMALKTQ